MNAKRHPAVSVAMFFSLVLPVQNVWKMFVNGSKAYSVKRCGPREIGLLAW